MSITRRSFLKGSAATAAVSMVGANALETLAAPSAALAKGPGNKWEGRVVINYNKEATSGVTVNEAVVKKMVNDAILLLTGETTVGAAWKSVFPSSLTSASKVAIKTNILNAGNPCPHAFTVAAICEGLQQMDFSGTKFSAANITVYDMNNSNSMDTAGYTAARLPNIARVKDSAAVHGDGALNNRSYAKTLKNSDFLINVFSPRGHSIGSTFSVGFKSHYGTYSNPGGMHGSDAPDCLRDINCTGPVFNKTVLSMCSGIFGMLEGKGPTGSSGDYSTYSKKMDPSSTNTNPTTIIMSTDPVSCEMQTIKMMRMNNGNSYAVANLPTYLRASGGVTGALSQTYNIGVIDETKMDIRTIINGSNVTPVKHIHESVQTGAEINARSIATQNICFINYTVPLSFVNQSAKIVILTLDGKVVREYRQTIQGAKNHFSWDQCDAANSKVTAGAYLVSFKSGSLTMSTRVTIS